MLRRRVLPSAGGLQRFLAGSLSVIKPAATLSDEWEQYIPDSFGQRANIGIISATSPMRSSLYGFNVRLAGTLSCNPVSVRSGQRSTALNTAAFGSFGRGVTQASTSQATTPSAQVLNSIQGGQPSTLTPRHQQIHATTLDKVGAKAMVVFEGCWRRLEEKYNDSLQTPSEIIWLNGAPGSGKGANTPFILKSRGLSRAVSTSSLLEDNPSIKEVMDRGELVPDSMVGDALLETIFDPDDNDGAGLVMDGFPRTALQVDFLKLLYDKMMELHVLHAETPDEWRFPRPSFKVVVLYVEEEESIRRQMMRAQLANMHNKRAMDAGTDDLWELRSTDVDISKCRRRYEVFKAHYSTLLRLKKYFPFSLIDAMGSLEECRSQISQELRYQSSLDLSEATYTAIRHLPLAASVVLTARQHLVQRLDGYCKRQNAVFMDVVRFIETEGLPLLRRCSLAGHAEIKTKSRLFSDHPTAVDMLIDVLSDRGFSVAYVLDEQVVPKRINQKTGEITNDIEPVHHFRITFERQGVREVAAMAAHAAESAESAKRIAIGQTFVPSHLRREESVLTAMPSGKDHYSRDHVRLSAPGSQPAGPLVSPAVAGASVSIADKLADSTPINSAGPRLENEFGYEMLDFDQKCSNREKALSENKSGPNWKG